MKFPKSVFRVTLRSTICLVTSLLLTLPAWGADNTKDEETLMNANKVLKEMLSNNTIPSALLARANCVVVLPGVKKFGFGVGGSGGRGPMICREGKNFMGRWSAPAMYTIGGASVGFQVGGSSTDFVILVMSQKGVDALLQGKTKLGNEATAAAGPSGATSVNTVGGTDMLTYGKASGLFAGMSLGGASLEPDRDANQRLYGRSISATEILLQHAVQPTPGGSGLVADLNASVAKHTYDVH